MGVQADLHCRRKNQWTWRYDNRKFTKWNTKRKKIFKNVTWISDFGTTSSLCVTGVPKGSNSEGKMENIFEEIMVEIFPSVLKTKSIDLESQQTPSTRNIGGKNNYSKLIW